MATYTPNLNLKKPAGTDNMNINDINTNMDIIDGLLSYVYQGTLPTGTNLDDVIVPGFYLLSSNYTYYNKPTRSAAAVLVLRSSKTSTAVFQFGIGTDLICFRVRTAASTWRDWMRLDPSGNGWVDSCDIDTLLDAGTYGLSVANTYQHLPNGVTGGILEVIQPNLSSKTYMMQRLVQPAAMYVRYRNQSSGSAWGSWYKYTGTAV